MFSDNLKEWRKKRNLTQKDLGEALSVSKGTISNWEQDLRQPDIQSLILISNCLEISLDQLLETDSYLKFHGDKKFILNSYSSLSTEGKKKVIERINELIKLEHFINK